MLTTQTIFDRYQQVRARFPEVATRNDTIDIHSLLDIADGIDAFVFDAFGVLNVGEDLIPGADRRLAQLRDRGCAIRVLTNAASYNRAGAIAKFKRLGLALADSEIITSRDVTLMHLDGGHWGVIAAADDPLGDMPVACTRLGDTAAEFDRVDRFLFLSTAGWTDHRQQLLELSMQHHPRAVFVANADLAAPRDYGFSREPGHFGHLIEDRFPGMVRFFGKPFPEVYDLVEKTLPEIQPDRIAMCGDTLHTDILGAAARGWRTVLVSQDGLFAWHDTTCYAAESGVFADWRLGRI
ncbi:MAG: HAD hydrolase-like protein [Albidovulum sp.]